MKNNFEEKTFEGLEGDLRLYYCGKRIGNVGHGFGPYTRDDYLIYYIKEGEAELRCGDKCIPLFGEGFFVNFPKSNFVYRSQEALPWSIKWVSVGGELVGPECPFLSLKNGRELEMIFDEMYEHFDKPSLSSRIYCVSLLHKLFSLISADRHEHAEKSRYVKRALAMIEEKYADPILSVFSIAKELNLHPNYFSIIFKRETGELPKRVILDTRMRNASKMLRFTDRPIKEIAREVGFTDELYFSRAFRAQYGSSPTEYRRTFLYLT